MDGLQILLSSLRGCFILVWIGLLNGVGSQSQQVAGFQKDSGPAGSLPDLPPVRAHPGGAYNPPEPHPIGSNPPQSHPVVSNPPDPNLLNQVQMELDKDILKHTIHYLRSKLVECLSQSSGASRRKRKAHLHHLLEFEVEIDILKNTKEYLTTRLVTCRQTAHQLETEAPNQDMTSDSGDLYETSQVLTADHHSNAKFDQVVNLEGHSNSGTETLHSNNKFGHHSNNQKNNKHSNEQHSNHLHSNHKHSNRHHDDKSGERKFKHENELKVAALSRTINYTATTESPSTTTKTTTTTTASPAQTFIVNGRAVECGSYTESNDGSSFICRNVWVDSVWRLPNSDLCLPGYNPSRWRHLATIQSATFSVLDLKSLCREMGKSSGLGSKVRDVRVVWDCGDTHYRLTFQSGKWTGSVEDNGYLHDLQCVYSN